MKTKYIPHDDNIWICCGKKSDKHLVKYIVQVIFGLILVGFSITQISIDVPNKEVYFSLISSIFGYFLPSPGYETLRHASKKQDNLNNNPSDINNNQNIINDIETGDIERILNITPLS